MVWNFHLIKKSRFGFGKKIFFWFNFGFFNRLNGVLKLKISLIVCFRVFQVKKNWKYIFEIPNLDPKFSTTRGGQNLNHDGLSSNMDNVSFIYLKKKLWPTTYHLLLKKIQTRRPCFLFIRLGTCLFSGNWFPENHFPNFSVSVFH